MKFSPEVCLEPRKNRLYFWEDLDCDPDSDYDPDLTDLHETFINDQSIKLLE